MSGRRAYKKDRHEGLGLVRVLNEQAVLEAILNNSGISRPEIAALTGLSLPTIVSLVAALEHIDLVRQQGLESGKVGRPAALYSVNPHAGYVFAVNLAGAKVRAGITNLFGEVLAECEEAKATSSSDSILNQLRNIHDQLVKNLGFDQHVVGAASIGVPGVWDPKTDLLDAAYNLPAFHDRPLQASIQQTLNLPVIIENDVNLAAVGESWKGNAQGHDTFVVFSVNRGIGLGIVIDCEIYRGSRGAAGEVELLPIGANPFDPQVRSGGGPFEAAASGSSLSARLGRALTKDVQSTLTVDADITQIIAAAEKGDKVGQAIFEDEARALAIGVAAVVAVLDPTLVILGGSVGTHPKLVQKVKQYAAQLIPRMPSLEVSSLGHRAVFYGAIALGLPVARQQILIETRARG